MGAIDNIAAILSMVGTKLGGNVDLVQFVGGAGNVATLDEIARNQPLN